MLVVGSFIFRFMPFFSVFAVGGLGMSCMCSSLVGGLLFGVSGLLLIFLLLIIMCQESKAGVWVGPREDPDNVDV